MHYSLGIRPILATLTKQEFVSKRNFIEYFFNSNVSKIDGLTKKKDLVTSSVIHRELDFNFEKCLVCTALFRKSVKVFPLLKRGAKQFVAKLQQ